MRYLREFAPDVGLLLIVALVSLMALTGCAERPKDPLLAYCKVPTVRDAGMGVTLKDCGYYEFGPSRTQQAAFNSRLGLVPKNKVFP